MNGSKWFVITDVDFGDSEGVSSHKTPWHYLSSEWEHKFPNDQLWKIEHASYVITISRPFTIDYPKSHSPVIYVGEGMAHARFRDHLGHKLIPMLENLRGAKFDFWVLPCDDKSQIVATEAQMLDHFDEQYGGKPLFNVQSGKNTSASAHPDWFQPLDGRRRGKRHWAIRPLK